MREYFFRLQNIKSFFIVISFMILFIPLTACGRLSKETDSAKELFSEEEVSDAENKKDKEQENIEQKEGNIMINIQIGEHVLTATLVENSSTQALLEMLSEGSVTIKMSDYANMEKVGPFPKSLPRNDEQIDTKAGDLILYQGTSFVIYYDTNSWNFTRLGKINDVTSKELKEILGDGDIKAVLSIPEE